MKIKLVRAFILSSLRASPALLTASFFLIPFISLILLPAYSSPLVESNQNIVTTLSYPEITFNCKSQDANITTTYTFTTSGGITVNLSGEAFVLAPDLSASGVVSTKLYSNETHVAQTYTVKLLGQQKAYVEVYADFSNARKDSCGYLSKPKWTIVGNQQLLPTLTLTFNLGKYLRLSEQSGERFYFGDGRIKLLFDWSDAKKQGFTYTYNNSTQKLRVTVGPNFSIDPATVGTSTSSSATSPDHRRSVWGSIATRYWVFYFDGTNHGWRSSTDGDTWSAFTAITTTIGGAPELIAYYVSSTTIHYLGGANAAGNPNFYWRNGTLGTDGTISWGAAEATISAGASMDNVKWPSLVIDTDGDVWASFQSRDLTPTNRLMVWERGGTGSGGSWTNRQNTTSGAGGEASILVALTAGKVSLLNGGRDGQSAISAENWDTSTWSSFVATTGTNYRLYLGSAVALSDTLHFAIGRAANSVEYMTYTRAAGWSAATVIESSLSGTEIYASIASGSTNRLAIVYTNGTGGSNEIRYRSSADSGSTWRSATNILTAETTPSWLNLYQTIYGGSTNTVSMTFVGGTASPFNVRFDEEALTFNTAPTIGEFTASVSWRPNTASNLVWRYSDADGNTDVSTCRITGTVNSAGSFDFTYTRSTDGIAWTTQPTGLTAGTASKSNINSTSDSVTVPLTFSGAYAQVGTATITTTNTLCTDAASATGSLGSNTNVGTLYGRISWTINDNSGSALTPSGTVYIRWNNGTARQNSGNTLAVTGQTDTSVQYSVQWQNSTASNAYVFGETTLTMDEAWENVTVTTLVYPSLTYAFRRADASTSITPTNIVITVPNNDTAKTLTSFSSLKLPNGTITVTSISYLGGNARLNGTDSHSFTAASQTRTFNTRVYHGGSLAFRRNDNSTAITPTNMTVTAYNGTALTLTSFTGLIFGNGTNTVNKIHWGNANVRGNTSDNFSQTANSQAKTYNLRIYNILPGFNRNGGSALNTAVTSWKITSVNSTASGTLTGSALVTNGSATIGTVLWRAIDVTPSSTSFTPSASNPSFSVNVYADTGNNMQSAVDTGTLSSVAFSGNTLSFTVSSVSGSKQVITEIIAADYKVTPLTVKVAGSTVTNHTYTSPNLVSYTGAVGGLAMSEEWPAPGTGAGGVTPPPSSPPPATPSGGGGGAPPLTTTVTTTAAPIEAIKARTEELRKQVQQKTALESEKTAGNLILVSLAAAFVIFTYSWYYKRSLLKSPSRDDLQDAYAKLKRVGRR